MFWLTLSTILIVAAAAGAVLLRQPGVMLYDWIATRKVATRKVAHQAARMAVRTAALSAPPRGLRTAESGSKAAHPHLASATPADHAEPAAALAQ